MIKLKRKASHLGDPAESDRLILPFLAWVGRRTNRECFLALGIDPRIGSQWVSGRRVLEDRHQRAVRRTLDEAGMLPSPCG